jgi:hypothetical protein
MWMSRRNILDVSATSSWINRDWYVCMKITALWSASKSESLSHFNMYKFCHTQRWSVSDEHKILFAEIKLRWYTVSYRYVSFWNVIHLSTKKYTTCLVHTLSSRNLPMVKGTYKSTIRNLLFQKQIFFLNILNSDFDLSFICTFRHR